MIRLLTDCELYDLLPESPITGFNCGDNDLNDFFNHDALLFQHERLGVSVEFAGQGIGSQLIESIKLFCDFQFSNLVRFLIVDAYNNDSVLSFYKKNDFSFVFSTEQQEKENLKKMISENENLYTRQMFYDMKRREK